MHQWSPERHAALSEAFSPCLATQVLQATRVLRLLTVALLQTFYVSVLNMFMLALFCNVRSSSFRAPWSLCFWGDGSKFSKSKY